MYLSQPVFSTAQALMALVVVRKFVNLLYVIITDLVYVADPPTALLAFEFQLSSQSCWCLDQSAVTLALATSGSKDNTTGYTTSVVGNCTVYPAMSSYTCQTVTYSSGVCTSLDGSGTCK